MYEYAVADPRDREKFVFHATPARRLTLALVRVLFRPVMKLQVNGLGDATIVRMESGDFTVRDGNNWVRKTRRRPVAVGVVRAGSYAAITPPPAE